MGQRCQEAEQLIARYHACQAYMNNQTEQSWNHLMDTILCSLGGFRVLLPDGSESHAGTSAALTVRYQAGFLEIRADGYGEKTAAEGYGAPVFLEQYEGELRVIVSPDINSEDKTIISLEGAREDRRDTF